MPPAETGPPATTDELARAIDLDPRSAIPLGVAVAVLAIGVWFVRSIPRTLSSLAIATLFALALNPIVDRLKRRTGWHRRTAAGVVLMAVGLVVITVLALITVPTIREVRNFNDQIPKTVRDLGTLPVVGPRLREANASKKVEDWLDDVPKRLSTDATPIKNAAGAIADGVAAALFTVLLAITLLLDGEHIVNGLRRLVPERRKHDADRLGRLVYDIIGRYIAGSLLVAALAGVVMLTGSIALGVPLAPLIAVWVSITNPIPQVGGFLGGVVFVLLGITQGALVGLVCCRDLPRLPAAREPLIQPLIIGRAVDLSPPVTMVAALVGVSAGGLSVACSRSRVLGATKAIYLSTRGRRRAGALTTRHPTAAEPAAVHNECDGVEQGVDVEVESARYEEVRGAFEHRHQRRDRRRVARRARVAHPAPEGSRDVGERITPSCVAPAISDVAFHPRADHGPVATIRREEIGEKAAQLVGARGVGRDRTHAAGERVHLVRALDRERAQQLLLVGEVQIERAVRHPRRPDDVVDARRMEAAFREHAHARVEELAHRLASLCPHLPRRRRGARSDRHPSADATTCTIASWSCPRRSRERPGGSRIVLPTSRRSAGRCRTPTSTASPARPRPDSSHRGVARR